MKRYIGWGMGVVLIGIVVWLGFWMTNPKPVTESVSDAAKNIFFDAKWYEVLWMRWTAVDWILSLLAAGTAIAAAVQNAFSNHAQAQAQAAAQAAPTTARVDRLVMWFAALTIVATTLDAKIHPAQLAERYRQGDLLLQDGIMDYRHSQKTAADEQALLDVWHQAQRILEGAPGGGRKVASSDKTDGAGAQ
jgi:hypothetical protein